MKALSLCDPLFGNLFNDFWAPSWGLSEKTTRDNGAKIEATEDGSRILIPFPGLSPGDVDITVKDGVLNISASESNEDRHFSYRSYSYDLAGYSEDVEAVMKDGLLTVDLHRAKKEIDEGRKIKVLEA